MSKYMLLLWIIASGCSTNHNDFMAEIKALEKPKGFNRLIVNDIVVNYLPIGSSEYQMAQFFKINQFNFFTKEKNDHCVNAEKMYLGTRDFDFNALKIAEYRLVGYFCVSNGKLNKMTVYFLKHHY